MVNLRQIGKELFREKTRIILTILAIAWGTFTIAMMLAIGTGLRVTFMKTFTSAGHNYLSVRGGRTTLLYQGISPGVKVNLSRDDLNAIAKLPNIKAISPQYIVTAGLRYKTKVVGQNVLAVTPNYAKIRDISILPGGRFITSLDMDHSSPVIVLGEQSAKELFPQDPNPIGKIVKVKNMPFMVVGVMQHKPRIVARRTADAFNNWMPVTTARLLISLNTIDELAITYKNHDLLPQLEQHIQQAVALNHGADPNDSNVVHFSEFAKRQQKVDAFLLGLQIFLGIVGSLTLLVAGVGIANVMYASVNRSIHEIGIRMALGAKTYHILWHYIAEALLATFIGGFVGLSVAAALVHVLQHIPYPAKMIAAIGNPRPVLSVAILFLIVAVLGVIGFLAALFPALKATKVDPTEALSYE